jgi:predicted nucleic acid-binding protein
MLGKALAVDSNILVRAVLGRRVRELIETYSERVSLLVPEAAYAEAEEHLPNLVLKRGGDPDKALTLLRALGQLVELIGSEVYGRFESVARERLKRRDPEDWPVLATALAFDCPVWTEDRDFFGCGIATWTSERVEIFLRE